MVDPIFERYKEALKAGHLAVLRGRADEAIGHYREAAEIAPERPLPHTSLAGVLLREGRLDLHPVVLRLGKTETVVNRFGGVAARQAEDERHTRDESPHPHGIHLKRSSNA